MTKTALDYYRELDSLWIARTDDILTRDEFETKVMDCYARIDAAGLTEEVEALQLNDKVL